MSKLPLPASLFLPALRSRTACAREPEVPPPCDLAASFSDANSQGEPLPRPVCKAEEPPKWGAMFHVFPSIPTQMDYKGQKLAEQIFQGIILFSAVIGFIYGYITEQFGWTVYIVMGGFAVSCLLTLPPWPIYRRNPLKWLPVQEVATDEKKPADRKVKRHPKN
ncbi:signal peptidase complex subunit 1 [Anolis sagrei]|uniref:signal peptidase complex subunit 1 n=1 Tax=Anolis sagrei TaxID=38937 RepID=UPI00295BF94C|nr:signal peptidase complex subunit 1 [Anolis sagrei ordinatus]